MIRRWFRRRQLVCREAVALMSDYVDGVLDQRDRGRLDAHLADCELCTEYLAQLRATIDVLWLLRLIARSVTPAPGAAVRPSASRIASEPSGATAYPVTEPPALPA